MPKIKSEIKHFLLEDKAILRLKENFEWAESISDLKTFWQGNIMDFSVSIQGIKLKGNIEVTEDSLKLEATVPIIALPFKNWAPNILKHALKFRNENKEGIEQDSDTPLLFFLHIPKAGGTTLGEFIYNQCQSENNNNHVLIKNGIFYTPGGFFRGNEPNYSPQIQTLLQRKDLKAVIGHFSFGIHLGVTRPFNYVTMLRDPVSRIVSIYSYLTVKESISLEQFIDSTKYREIENDQTRRISGINSEFGQCCEKDLQLAKYNIAKYFSVVGTTERFNETLTLLKQNFNWHKNIPVHPKNVNDSRISISSINNNILNKIKYLNRFDIELYEYVNKIMDEMF